MMSQILCPADPLPLHVNPPFASLDLHHKQNSIDRASEQRRKRSRGLVDLVAAAMLLAVLFANSDGNILVERFHGVPAEERLHWRSFLVKLGTENLKGAKSEELYIATHKSVFIVYTMLGDICIYVVGKDEYDELALKSVCGKPPTERIFLDKYGRICLCLDEIVWKGMLDNTDKDRIRRLTRLKAPVEP